MNVFGLSEDIVDKLKCLNYENQFCRARYARCGVCACGASVKVVYARDGFLCVCVCVD